MDEKIFLMKAIILAAGKGSRIGNFTKSKHKSLLEIQGKSLLNRMVDQLRDLNIKDILIITGYKNEGIRKEIKKKARYLYFPKYKNTNNLQTLLFAKKEINSSFICLFADVYFDNKILSSLVKNKKDICLAIDTSKILKDTMRIKKTNNNIIDIGPHIPILESHGNFIGLAKFSKEGSLKLKESLINQKKNNKDYYTLAIKKIIENKKKENFIDCKKSFWKEIDYHKDYVFLKNKYDKL